MSQKLLKLAKNLNQFSIDELLIILEEDTETVELQLENFIKAGEIKKLTQNKYSFINKNSRNKKVKVKLKEQRMIDNAPLWARKIAEKYIKALKESEKLKGKEITLFIERWNIENPNNRISASCLLRAKYKYKEFGTLGLLPAKQIFKKGQSSIPDELFYYFRDYYLLYSNLTMEKALDLAIEKYIKKHPEYSLNDIAGFSSFYRRLYNEFNRRTIDKYRSKGLLY